MDPDLDPGGPKTYGTDPEPSLKCCSVLYDRKGKGRRGVGGGGGGQERGGKEERRYLTIGYLGELTRDQEETLTRSPLRECQNIHANVKRYGSLGSSMLYPCLCRVL
jgi:hypothetical protein